MMRAQLEKKLTDTWYGAQPPSLWMRALTPVYGLASRLDRWLSTRRRCTDLDRVCIIVVGNITAGGSGKTPLVIRLCQILKEVGLAPGVVSRGYGREDEELRLVCSASDPAVVGDEPLLIARRSGVPVVVAADRCEAVRSLLKKNVNIIVSDDGLQHYRLPRDVEICVVDGVRGFGNGQRIPAGPLREPVKRLYSVDHVVVNGESGFLPADLAAESMHLAPGMLRSLNDDLSWRLAQFKGCKVNAVAGIGHPQNFFALLRNYGINVIEHIFPDHHDYSEDDFRSMDRAFPILMTEKDAVKCTGMNLKNAWFLTVDAALTSEWENSLLRQVMQIVGDKEAG
jgi:tetraacyldisaccharide 4'-kinase